MSVNLRRYRAWFEPSVAVVFVVLWIVAEAGRVHAFGALALLVAFGAAIAISRAAPMWALGIISAALILQTLRVAPLPEPTSWPVYLAVIFVAFVAGQLPGEKERWLALAAGIPFSVIIAHLMAVPMPDEYPRWTAWTGSPSSGTYIAGAFLTIGAMGIGLYVGAWALGFAVRLNVMQLQGRYLLQHTARDLAIAETELLNGRDRDWIAREVHDLLAHSLAVVTAQADGARLSPSADLQAKDAALLAISGAARAALIDMQSLVEALREEPVGGPQPSLGDLHSLLDRLASAGMEVSVQNFGHAKELTPAKELAVYRILQESLTNSLRHAGAHVPARVAFDWRGPGLALSVTSAPTASSALSTTGAPFSSAVVTPSVSTVTTAASARTSASTAVSVAASVATPGHGIRGMKDRARLAGGWLTAGEVDEADASFIVAAFFPTDEPASSSELAGAASSAASTASITSSSFTATSTETTL